jgi:hypothetical protein
MITIIICTDYVVSIIFALQHPHAMLKSLVLTLSAVLLCKLAIAQQTNNPQFRVGASIAFGLTNIAHNTVGIGGVAGVEKKVNKVLAAEAEVAYTYFTGDKSVYMQGKNKAWNIPLMAGVKAYVLPGVYGSLRAGGIYFLLNDQPDTHIRPCYGVAAGTNFPQRHQRLNVQLGYTGFRYNGDSRGYATLAASIIIN